MNELTLRQKSFVNLLINEKSYKPIKYFSDILNVSDKTLQKDLKIITQYLEKFNVEIIKKTGYGVLIEKDAYKNIDLLNYINIQEKEQNQLSLVERRSEILKSLLIDSNKNTSIQKLSNKYYISKASIVNDFKFIEEWLNKYELSLTKSKEGTKINGSESNIRKSIASLISELPNEKNKRGNSLNLTRLDIETFNSLTRLFSIDSILFMESEILKLEQNLNCTIVQPYYINLLTHMLIFLKRVNEGNQIINSINIDKTDDNFDEEVYENVIMMVDKIYDEYQVEINESEIYYIYQYIVSSRLRNLPNENLSVIKGDINNISKTIAREMIKYMSDAFNFDFTKDPILYEGIYCHIRPMLNRLIYDIQIKNPLIEDIIERFSEMLKLCEATSIIILKKYNFSTISIDEVAYLATYFQAAIERSIIDKRVIVVCHSGYGTSQLLTTRLKRAFPNWIIVDIISIHKLSKSNLDDIDFIISTVNLDIKYKPYVIVSALLSEKDIKNINNTLVENA